MEKNLYHFEVGLSVEHVGRVKVCNTIEGVVNMKISTFKTEDHDVEVSQFVYFDTPGYYSVKFACEGSAILEGMFEGLDIGNMDTGTMRSVEARAFKNCRKLDELGMSFDVFLEYIGEEAFAGCVKLHRIIVMDAHRSLEIEDNAFDGISEQGILSTKPLSFVRKALTDALPESWVFKPYVEYEVKIEDLLPGGFLYDDYDHDDTERP